MQPSPDFVRGTDMTDDLWLFDVGNRDSYQLAVQFHDKDGHLSADIYEDENGDGKVSVGQKDGHPTVTELGYPAVQINALDGYWQRDGRIAPDFDLTIDGKLLATFGGELYESAMRNDGKPDVVIRVRGPHGDDPRSWDWRNVYTPVPASSGIYRTTLMVREHGQEPAYPPVFPWYLLGGTYGAVTNYEGGKLPTVPLAGTQGRPYGIVKPDGQSFPPVQVDWTTGKIAYIGEFVASRGSNENWFTYSIKQIESGKLTDPNFESPFAFYNLADAGEINPDLAVRDERITPNYPYNLPQWQGRAYQQIRYSWQQSFGQGWSYKLGLLGQHSIDTIVHFPDFSLQTTPYATFPNWVVEHRWAIATFVAVEKPTYRSTEGIYEWDPSGDLRDQYYAGVSNGPGEPFATISAGMRGEYSLHFQSRPLLYLSPVDGQLHLLSATQGIYQIDQTHHVEYRSLSGNGHIDDWRLYNDAKLLAELVQVPGGLIYSANGQVSFLKANIPAEVFRTLPPTDHTTWLKLGQQLKANQRAFTADDLTTMFTQFSGQRTTIAGATMRDFQMTPSGYHFALQLRPGYDLDGLAISGIRGAGSYAVSFTAQPQEFVATPLTPPDLTLSVRSTSTNPRALTPVNFQVTLHNQGAADAPLAPLIVTAEHQGSPPRLITQRFLRLDGSSQRTITASWSPPTPGRWHVNARLYLPDGEVVDQTTTLAVAMPPTVGWQTVITAAWPATSPWVYLLALLGLAGLGVAGGTLLMGQRTVRWRR